MIRYDIVRSVNNVKFLAVAIHRDGAVQYQGLSTKAEDWAEWASQNLQALNSKSIGADLEVMQTSYASSEEQLSQAIQRLKQEGIPMRNKGNVASTTKTGAWSTTPSFREFQLGAFAPESREMVIDFKALAFVADSLTSSRALVGRLKGPRANIERQAGSLSTKAARPKLGARIGGGLRSPNPGMAFVDVTGQIDADADGIVFERTPMQRPIIPRLDVSGNPLQVPRSSAVRAQEQSRLAARRSISDRRTGMRSFSEPDADLAAELDEIADRQRDLAREDAVAAKPRKTVAQLRRELEDRKARRATGMTSESRVPEDKIQIGLTFGEMTELEEAVEAMRNENALGDDTALLDPLSQNIFDALSGGDVLLVDRDVAESVLGALEKRSSQQYDKRASEISSVLASGLDSDTREWTSPALEESGTLLNLPVRGEDDSARRRPGAVRRAVASRVAQASARQQARRRSQDRRGMRSGSSEQWNQDRAFDLRQDEMGDELDLRAQAEAVRAEESAAEMYDMEREIAMESFSGSSDYNDAFAQWMADEKPGRSPSAITDELRDEFESSDAYAGALDTYMLDNADDLAQAVAGSRRGGMRSRTSASERSGDKLVVDSMGRQDFRAVKSRVDELLGRQTELRDLMDRESDEDAWGAMDDELVSVGQELDGISQALSGYLREDRGRQLDAMATDIAIEKVRGRISQLESGRYEDKPAGQKMKAELERALSELTSRRRDLDDLYSDGNGAERLYEEAGLDEVEDELSIDKSPRVWSRYNYDWDRVDMDVDRETAGAFADELLDEYVGDIPSPEDVSRVYDFRKIQLDTGNSRAIEKLTWDGEEGELIVTFAGGRTYTYKDVPDAVAGEIESSPENLGRLINDIKKNYEVQPGGEHAPDSTLTENAAQRARYGMRSRSGGTWKLTNDGAQWRADDYDVLYDFKKGPDGIYEVTVHLGADPKRGSGKMTLGLPLMFRTLADAKAFAQRDHERRMNMLSSRGMRSRTDDNSWLSRVGTGQTSRIDVGNSRAVQALTWDDRNRQLIVTYGGRGSISGRTYTYGGVDPDLIREIETSPESLGKLINDVKRTSDYVTPGGEHTRFTPVNAVRQRSGMRSRTRQYDAAELMADEYPDAQSFDELPADARETLADQMHEILLDFDDVYYDDFLKNGWEIPDYIDDLTREVFDDVVGNRAGGMRSRSGGMRSNTPTRTEQMFNEPYRSDGYDNAGSFRESDYYEEAFMEWASDEGINNPDINNERQWRAFEDSDFGVRAGEIWSDEQAQSQYERLVEGFWGGSVSSPRWGMRSRSGGMRSYQDIAQAMFRDSDDFDTAMDDYIDSPEGIDDGEGDLPTARDFLNSRTYQEYLAKFIEDNSDDIDSVYYMSRDGKPLAGDELDRAIEIREASGMRSTSDKPAQNLVQRTLERADVAFGGYARWDDDTYDYFDTAGRILDGEVIGSENYARAFEDRRDRIASGEYLEELTDDDRKLVAGIFDRAAKESRKNGLRLGSRRGGSRRGMRSTSQRPDETPLSREQLDSLSDSEMLNALLIDRFSGLTLEQAARKYSLPSREDARRLEAREMRRRRNSGEPVLPGEVTEQVLMRDLSRAGLSNEDMDYLFYLGVSGIPDPEKRDIAQGVIDRFNNEYNAAVFSPPSDDESIRPEMRSRSVGSARSRSSLAVEDRAKQQRSVRATRGLDPGVSQTSDADGRIWAGLTDDDKSTVTSRARQREKDLLTYFKRRYPNYWAEVMDRSQSDKWKKKEGWIDEETPITQMIFELDSRVRKSQNDPNLSATMKAELLRNMDDLRTLFNMRNNDSYEMLEHLHPSSRGYLFDDAKRNDGKTTAATASGVKRSPSTFFGKVNRAEIVQPEAATSTPDGGSDAAPKKEKAPVGERVAAWAEKMRDSVLYESERRRRLRQMREARKNGVNAGAFSPDERQPLKPLERKARLAKRALLLKKGAKRDIPELTNDANKNRVVGRLAVRDAEGNVTISENLPQVLGAAFDADKKHDRLKKSKKKAPNGGWRNEDLAFLWDGAGYNGTPMPINQEQYDALLKAGWTPLVRGHGANRYAEDYIDDPVRFIPGQGGEAAGPGEYFALMPQGNSWYSYVSRTEPSATVGLLPPEARRISQSELREVQRTHRNLVKAIRAFDSGLPEGEREKMDGGEYADQLIAFVRDSLGDSHDSIMGSDMGQIVAQLLNQLSTASPSRKRDILDSLKYLNLIANKDTPNYYAPILGYDTISVDERELVMNRTSVVVLGETKDYDGLMEIDGRVRGARRR